MKSVALLLAVAACGVALAAAGSFTATPLGVRPSQCVHQVPAGSHIEPIEGGVWVHAPDGTNTWLPEIPECVEDMKARAAAWVAARAGNTSALQGVTPSPEHALGWLDYVSYTLPTTQHLSNFNGYYTVPGNPQDTTGSEVLFYFIGAENIEQSDVSILQPVLTWGNGLTGWSYASWNCCPSGQQHESTPIQGFSSGDKLYGEISRGNGKWTVTSANGGQATNLTTADNGRNFDWLDVTLEVYNIDGCSDFANGPMTFSQMKATDTSGEGLTIQWKADSSSTQCNGQTTVKSPSEVIIQHN